MVTFAAGLGVLAGVTGAQAAAGGLDTSFGTGGIVTTSYNGPFPGNVRGRSLLVSAGRSPGAPIMGIM